MLKRIQLNLDFGLLALCVLLFNFWFLGRPFLVVTDAFSGFTLYYFLYNNLFFNNELAQWIPYGAYGLPAAYNQLTSLTPITYVVMFLGCLLRVKNVYLLFQLTLLAEQFVFLAGMYLLCRFLFKKRSTVFWVCLAAAGSTVCYTQPFFNFRIYYLFPFVAFLWLSFFQEKKDGFFWLGCLVCLVWATGNAPYFVPLLFFLSVFFCLIFFLSDKTIWRRLFARSPRNLLPLGLFLFLLAIYGYFAKNSLHRLSLAAISRNASGTTDLTTFLTWGGNPSVPKLIKGFFFAFPPYLKIGSLVDVSIYIGLASLVFLAWAIGRVRSAAFFAFLIPALSFLWLSFGGLFARAAYHLIPMMSYYRHIGLVLSFMKILLLICAGFGFEDFLSSRLKKKMFGLSLIFAFVFFLWDTLPDASTMWYLSLLPKDIFGKIRLDEVLFRFRIYAIFFSAAALLSLLLFVVARLRHARVPRAVMGQSAVAALMLACFFDLLSFQASAAKAIPQLPKKSYGSLDCLRVHEMPFQEERQFMNIFNPPKERLSRRQEHAIDLFFFQAKGIYYALDYNFIQFDPLSSVFGPVLIEEGLNRLRRVRHRDKSAVLAMREQLRQAADSIGIDFRTDLMMRGVHQLLQVDRPDKTLITAFGGYYPKLRLVPRAYFVEDSKQALEAVGKIPDIVNTVVLTGAPGKRFLTTPQAMPARGRPGRITVTHFSANDIKMDVIVENPDGAWLVYADAYHPGWKAAVNGRRTPVVEAYGAFKAVHLDPGKQKVRFYFFNGLSTVCAYLIALFGLASGFFLLAVFVFNFRKSAIHSS